MSIIYASEFVLKRARREMLKSHERQDWTSVRYWDDILGKELNDAYTHRSKNTRTLLIEMEKILSAYGTIVADLPDSNRYDIGFTE